MKKEKKFKNCWRVSPFGKMLSKTWEQHRTTIAQWTRPTCNSNSTHTLDCGPKQVKWRQSLR